MKSVYATAKEISPNHEIIDLLALKYDYPQFKGASEGKVFK